MTAMWWTHRNAGKNIVTTWRNQCAIVSLGGWHKAINRTNWWKAKKFKIKREKNNRWKQTLLLCKRHCFKCSFSVVRKRARISLDPIQMKSQFSMHIWMQSRFIDRSSSSMRLTGDLSSTPTGFVSVECLAIFLPWKCQSWDQTRVSFRFRCDRMCVCHWRKHCSKAIKVTSPLGRAAATYKRPLKFLLRSSMIQFS